MSQQTALDFLVSSTMTDAEVRVWRALRTHEGRDRAIKADLLAELAGMNVRNVQRAIHSLIHDHRKSIGGAMDAPAGYYVAVTREDREEAARLLSSRAKAMLATAAIIEGVTTEEYLRRHQTELLADEAEAA